ncbi:MAG: hypothetical protein LBD14_02540 [Puniceicoccales bacterium]|jgi:hypothetical protein|nr:hypothetical protein [Puniceicoccales bacterium]
MHDDPTHIEDALRRLAPRPPSEFCKARIAVALDATANARARRLIFLSTSLAAAAAACIAVIVTTSLRENRGAGAGTAPSTALAVSTTPPPGNERRALSSIEPLEIRRAPDGRYFQPYRVRYLNTVSLPSGASATSGAPPTLVRTMPVEEVHFVGLDLI